MYFKEWRKHAGYTQVEVAKALGVSVAKVSRAETGKRDFSGRYLEGFAALCRCPNTGAPISYPPSCDAMLPKGNNPKARLTRELAMQLVWGLIQAMDDPA